MEIYDFAGSAAWYYAPWMSFFYLLYVYNNFGQKIMSYVSSFSFYWTIWLPNKILNQER